MSSYDWKENLPQEDPGTAMQTAQKVEAGRSRIKRTVGDHMSVIFIIVALALQILLPFVTAGYRNPLTPDYLLNTTLSVSSSLLSWYLFLPTGRRDRAGMPDYRETTARWQEISRKIIETGRLAAFRAFCMTYAKEERQRVIDDRLTLLAGAGITSDAFGTVWRDMTRRRLAAMRRQGQLTKEQHKLILLCQKPVRERPVSPNFILCGNRENSVADVVRSDGSYERRAKIAKPFLNLLWVVLITFFFPTTRENVDALEVVSNIVVRIFCVCMSSFSGYMTGARAAGFHMTNVSGRTVFMEEFLERDGAKS